MSVQEPAVSVVIPCFNEVGSLSSLHQQLRAVFAEIEVSAEIIFIDDGSNDGSLEVLRALAAEDADCRVIVYRRNCGKAAALMTGFRLARGSAIITMDADLQDDPREIPRFLEALETADVVSGWKFIRHDPPSKTLPSRLFNATVRRMTGVPLHDMNCGFKAYRRAVLQEVNLYGELHRYIPALAAARGFRIAELIVTHHPRESGKSKYGWERYIRGLLDLFTVIYLMKYRFRPMHLFGSIGLLCFLVSVILGFSLAIPLIVLPKANVPSWHFFMWLLATALLIMAPVFVGLGLVAESQLAVTFPQQPAPPIIETVNCIMDLSGEGQHAA